MIYSRNNVTLALLVLALTSEVLAEGAFAQGLDYGQPAAAYATEQPLATETPRSILLSPERAQPAVPDLGPEVGEAGSAGVMTSPAQPAAKSGIEVETLDVQGPAAIGLLDATNGGLPSTLWAGSRMSEVRPLMLKLPVIPGSPATQTLMRQLLQTAAPPPRADDGANSGIDFLLARFDRLAAMGDLEALQGMLGRVGADMEDENEQLARYAIIVNLLSQNYGAACAAAAVAAPAETDAGWLKLATFCRSLSGDQAGAQLGIEMLQEMQVKDPAFYQLIAIQMAGGPAADAAPPVVASLKAPTPLLIALARLTRAQLPADVLSGASPLILTRLAGLPGLDIGLRLNAATAVTRLGGFDPARLAQIYMAFAFTPEEFDRVGVDDFGHEDFGDSDLGREKGDALLHQALLSAPTTARRVEILHSAFARARTHGDLPLYALVSAPVLETMTPSGETLTAAPEIVRLLLLAGRTEKARAWYDFISAEAGNGNAAAAGFLADLWPLMMVAAPVVSGASSLVFSPDRLDLWWRGREAAAAPDRQSEAALLFALLEADGQAIPDHLKAAAGIAVSAPSPAPAPVEDTMAEDDGSFAVAQPSAPGLGETALSALIACGPAGPGAAVPATLATVFHDLIAVGLEPSARRIALEALIARGL